MKIEVMDIAVINENPNNPRVIKDGKFKKLVKSIKDFPQMLSIRPIVVNDDLMVLGGNQRLKACREAKLKEIPIIKASELTKEQELEFIAKDNSAFGEWDWEQLLDQYDEVILSEWGIDLPDEYIEDIDLSKEVLTAEEDGYVEPDELKTSIVLGDLIEIGRHRLLCGDSTKKEDVERLMNGTKADMVFTDPPYSVNYAEKCKTVLKSKNYVEIKNDDMSVEDTSSNLWSPSFKNMYEVAKDDCSFYMTMPQGGDQMMMMMMMMMKENWQVKHELIWVKEAPVFSMGRLDYDYKHEPIMYGWKKKHNFYGKGAFTKSVWEIPRKENKLHPTMKPVALIENAILNSSIGLNSILDPFLGSGSTMVACEQLNRICYGIELDPHYCQVIIDRMRKLNPEITVNVNGEELSLDNE